MKYLTLALLLVGCDIQTPSGNLKPKLNDHVETYSDYNKDSVLVERIISPNLSPDVHIFSFTHNGNNYLVTNTKSGVCIIPETKPAPEKAVD